MQVAARYMEEYTAGCFRLRAQFSTERQIMAIKVRVCGLGGGGGAAQHHAPDYGDKGTCAWGGGRITSYSLSSMPLVFQGSDGTSPLPLPAGAGGQSPVVGGGDRAHARRPDEDALSLSGAPPLTPSPLPLQVRADSPQWVVEETERTRAGLMKMRHNVVLLKEETDPDSFYPR